MMARTRPNDDRVADATMGRWALCQARLVEVWEEKGVRR